MLKSKILFKKLLSLFKFKDKKDYQKFKIELLNLIKKKELDSIKSLKEKFLKDGYNDIVLNKIIFSNLKDIDRLMAISYGEKVLEVEEEPKFMRVLATRYKWIGEHKKYLELSKKIAKIEKKNQLQEIVRTIEQYNKNYDIEKIKSYVENIIKQSPELKNSIYKKLFSILKDTYTKEALQYAEEIITPKSDKEFIKVVANRYFKMGNMQKVQELRENFNYVKISVSWFKSELISFIENEEKNRENIEEFIASCKSLFDENEFNKIIFSVLKDKYPNLAIEYGLKYFESSKYDFKFHTVLGLRALRNHFYIEAVKIYSYLYEHDKMNSHLYENKLLEAIANANKEKILQTLDDDVVDFIRFQLPHKLQKNDIVYKLLFLLFKMEKGYEDKAIKFAELYLDNNSDSFIALSLSNFLFSQGYINKALKVKHLDMNDEKTILKIKHYQAYKKLLEHGFKLPTKREDVHIKNLKIGYCLHNTLPYNSGGYATRSHGLAKGVQLSGIDIQVISRLGYPNDLSSFTNSKELPLQEKIEGLMYHRLFTNINQYGVAPLDEYLQEYGEALYQKAKELNLTILHGASNFMNGIAANYAAKKLGIKSVYEVRGLWEITRISRQPEWDGSEHYEMIRRLEAEAAKNADAVLTITQALKDEMVSRGVPAEKITIVPNGVHVDRFQPLEKSHTLAKKLGVDGKTIIGFIGSFVQYEGLEYIVDAVEILVNKGKKDIVALMVGDGAVSTEVQQRVKDKGLDEFFIFTGRIPHEEVEGYYSLVDIAPLPRKGLPVCEMVSPLKPFEAMAMGKVVLASNVAALAEIVQDGYNGMLFEKDNVQDLADKIELLANDAELREKLGKQAREWVEKERDWKMLSQSLVKVYKGFLDG